MTKEKLFVPYASKAHLSIILLEYLLKNQKNEIVTFLQNDLKKEINLIMNLTNKYDGIKNMKINNAIQDIKQNVTIILEGDDKFIKESKKKITLMLNKSKNVQKVQIIICFEYNKSKLFGNNIIKNYKFLQTNGQKSIDELI